MKAIIPAAGLGTRFLPLTRAVPKEMLPIGATPAIELLVDEARRAGADEIVLVISRAKEMIRRYFEGARDLTFVYQDEQRGLGHAVLQAASVIRRSGEDADRRSHVLILLGDAIVTGCRPGEEMAAISADNDGASVIGLEKVPPDRVSRYGIVRLENGRVVDLVEKPAPEEAPSDLAVAGRYLLDVAIFDFLATQTPGKGGEIQLTDAIRRMIRSDSPSGESGGGRVLLPCVYSGKRHDIGNPQGYFETLEDYYHDGD